jgi:hypothetical protein
MGPLVKGIHLVSNLKFGTLNFNFGFQVYNIENLLKFGILSLKRDLTVVKSLFNILTVVINYKIAIDVNIFF